MCRSTLVSCALCVIDASNRWKPERVRGVRSAFLDSMNWNVCVSFLLSPKAPRPKPPPAIGPRDRMEGLWRIYSWLLILGMERMVHFTTPVHLKLSLPVNLTTDRESLTWSQRSPPPARSVSSVWCWSEVQIHNRKTDLYSLTKENRSDCYNGEILQD